MFPLYCIQHNTNTTITIVLQEQKLITKWNYFTAFTMTTKKHRSWRWFEFLARPAGLEPATHRLEICCSIQLSHGRVACILQ